MFQTEILFQDIAADVLEYTAEGLRSEQSYKFKISQVSKGGQSIASDPTSSIYLAKAGLKFSDEETLLKFGLLW